MKNGIKICTYNYNEQGKLLDKLQNSNKTTYKYDKMGIESKDGATLIQPWASLTKVPIKHDEKGRLLEHSWYVTELNSTKALLLYRYIYQYDGRGDKIKYTTMLAITNLEVVRPLIWITSILGNSLTETSSESWGSASCLTY